MDASPSDDEAEANLRACGVEDKDVPVLLQAARTLSAQVAAQPQGLLHQDFLPDNLGWRGDREEMVVYDLHKNALGPRFADVAPYLALPDWSSRAAFLDTSEEGTVSRRESLVRNYLDEYAQFGGPVVAPQVFHEETTALFWMHKVAALGWLLQQQQISRVREVLDFLNRAAAST